MVCLLDASRSILFNRGLHHQDDINNEDEFSKQNFRVLHRD